jgi:phosphatidylglycerophosphate synthase
VKLATIRETARKRPEREFFINRLYGAHISPYFTYACTRLGLSPDQVTLLGAASGGVAIAILFLPLGWWSVVAVVGLQVAYILDFSDGQVARLTGRTSIAGSYLDWLTHFYLPVGAVLAVSASTAWQTGSYPVLVLGTLAALELAAFVFSCKEHILIAHQRDHPMVAMTSAFQAALRDDATAGDVLSAHPGPAQPGMSSGIAGRAHGPSLRSLVGEAVIYPGSLHLITLAVVLDLVLGRASAPIAARSGLLLLLAAAFAIHLPLAVRRNHELLRVVEAVSKSAGS